MTMKIVQVQFDEKDYQAIASEQEVEQALNDIINYFSEVYEKFAQ